MKKYTFLQMSILVLAGIISCNNAPETKVAEEETIDVVEETSSPEAAMVSESGFQLDMIIANNIASPIKLMIDMNEAGVKHYKEDATNPIGNLENYATADQKAIAFGIYGADMSYNSLYERNQDLADGLIAIRKLSKDLGLMHLFDQASFENFERIKSNADSVKFFLFEKYDAADEYLRSNDQITLSALILTGGLVESLHLVSAQMQTADANQDAYKIFLNQRHTLKSLLELYESMEKEGHSVVYKKDIEKLYAKFKEVDSFDRFSKDNTKSLQAIIQEVRAKMV